MNYKRLLTLFLLMLLINFHVLGQRNSVQHNGHIGLIFKQDSLIKNNSVSYFLSVKQVLANTSASESGIQVGDKLVSLNGITTGNNTMDVDRINQSMEGALGSSMSFEMERLESTKKTIRMTYVLDRKPIEIKNKVGTFGIGVSLNVDSVFIDDKLKYVAKIQVVYPFSPAERIGMEAGDLITGVDGHQVEGNSTTVVKNIIDLILKDEPTEIKLVFLHKKNSRYETYYATTRRTDISKYINMGIQNFPSLLQEVKNEELTKEEESKKKSEDRDGDGIVNKEDACPDEAGVESTNPFLNGCPEEE